MRFWLDCGVDGLRLDAIPYLCVREGTSNENLPETHAVIRQMRRVIDANYQNRMLLAEANQWPEDVREYFGDGDECHMAYHFPLMPRIFMAVAQEDRHPIVEIMRQTPDIPDNCQWAIFLRNHDELTLEMVTSRERDYMYKMYAADPRMRVNVGIRRRLAPLMDNDRDRIDLLMFVLMTMPGSPILYYGDEIGMGDNIFLGDRNGVRTPMQWSPDRNAGFSRADPQRLYLPPIMDPIYGYEAVNVESQSRSHSSLLNWTKRLITVRKNYRAFGRGSLKFLEPGNRKILAYVREYEDEVVLCVVNLSRSAQPVELDLSAYKGRVPVETAGPHAVSADRRSAVPADAEGPWLLRLPPGDRRRSALLARGATRRARTAGAGADGELALVLRRQARRQQRAPRIVGEIARATETRTYSSRISRASAGSRPRDARSSASKSSRKVCFSRARASGWWHCLRCIARASIRRPISCRLNRSGRTRSARGVSRRCRRGRWPRCARRRAWASCSARSATPNSAVRWRRRWAPSRRSNSARAS